MENIKEKKLLTDWQLFNKNLKNGLNDRVIKVIEEGLKFNQITKVQNSVIPYFIKNKDVIVKVFKD